ncbi:MAG: hypothetical protein KDA32_04305, partial [Phycisphaerales bacterium]|nr:hypothetical protein [Phycisphaerales bacterium]
PLEPRDPNIFITPPLRPPLRHGGWNRLTVRYTDNGGATFREAADFSSAFYSAWFACQSFLPLDPNHIDPNGPPVGLGFANIVQDLGPGLVAAGQELDPLLAEIQDVQLNEPSPFIDQVAQQVFRIRQALVIIGNQMQVFDFNDPFVYQELRNGWANLAGALVNVGGVTGSNRFQNAANVCYLIADRVDVSLQQVLSGMTTPQEQDLYLYGLNNGMIPHMRIFADAMMPHVCVDLTLRHVWFKSRLTQLPVVIQEADSRLVLDQAFVAADDRSDFYLPVFDQTTPIRLWVKTPNGLSQVLEVPMPLDGVIVPAPPVIQGDVNGDNCIDTADISAILADMGQGGALADFVPATDVNANGIVDPEDLAIAQGNLGLCGDLLPCRGDLDGSNSVDLADLAGLLSAFGSVTGDANFIPAADLDNDGMITLGDLAGFLALFGQPCPT